jgi:large repetitive protein
MIVNSAEGAQNVSLTIAAGDISKLSADVQAQIGNKPVIELSLKIDGKQTSWSNDSAPVTVNVPYTPTADELKDPEHITVWYIDGSGKAVSVPSGRYDPVTGKVTFNTTHFSKYAVAFVQKTFEDIGTYVWAKMQIEVMASKGIINGTSETSYNPAANITRADFLMLLVRTLGLTAQADSNFSDVRPSDYYCEALGIAKKLGISEGSGNNLFNPLSAITRQDMMTLTAKAMKLAGKLNMSGVSTDLEVFSDKESIAPYAAQSIASLVKAGLISGSGSRVNAFANTTRAETAVLMYRIYNK